MAKRSKTAAANPVENPDENPVNIADPLADKLAELQQGGADIYAHLYDLEGEMPEFLRIYQLDDFDLERVTKDFGGGKYRVMFRNAQNAFSGQHTFTISRRFARPTFAAPIVPAAAAPTPAPAPAPVVTAAVPMQAQSPDTMSAVLVAMIQSQGQLMAAIMSKPQSPPLSDAIMLEMLKRNTSSSKANELSDLVKVIRDLDGGGGDDEESPDEVITSLATPFLKQLATQQAQPTPAQPPQSLPPQPATPALAGSPVNIQLVQLIARVTLLFDLCPGDVPDAQPLIDRAAIDIRSTGFGPEILIDALTPYFNSLKPDRRGVALALAQRVLETMQAQEQAAQQSPAPNQEAKQ